MISAAYQKAIILIGWIGAVRCVARLANIMVEEKLYYYDMHEH